MHVRCLLEKIRCHLAYSTLTFESRSLKEPETHNLGFADWPGSSWDQLVFTPCPCLGLQAQMAMPGFFWGTGHPNSRTLGYTASIVLP